MEHKFHHSFLQKDKGHFQEGLDVSRRTTQIQQIDLKKQQYHSKLNQLELQRNQLQLGAQATPW